MLWVFFFSIVSLCRLPVVHRILTSRSKKFCELLRKFLKICILNSGVLPVASLYFSVIAGSCVFSFCSLPLLLEDLLLVPRAGPSRQVCHNSFFCLLVCVSEPRASLSMLVTRDWLVVYHRGGISWAVFTDTKRNMGSARKR